MDFTDEVREIFNQLFVQIPIKTINKVNINIKEFKSSVKQHLNEVSADGRGIGEFRKYLVNRRVFPSNQSLIEDKLLLLLLTLLSLSTMTYVYLFFHHDTSTLLMLGEYYQKTYDIKILSGSVVVFYASQIIFIVLFYYLESKNKFHMIKLLQRLDNKYQEYKLTPRNTRRFNLLVYLTLKFCNEYLMNVMVVFIILFNCGTAYLVYIELETIHLKFRLFINLIVKNILVLYSFSILISVTSCVCLTTVYLKYRFIELIPMLKTGIEQNDYRLLFGTIIRYLF